MKRVTEDKKWCLLMKHKYKITYNSPVVLSFVTACFVVMIINYITGGVSNKIAFMTYHSSLVSPMTYVRLFTHVLGHANWEQFYWKYGIHFTIGSNAGGKIWFITSCTYNCSYRSSDRCYQLCVFLGCGIMWSLVEFVLLLSCYHHL